MATGANDDDDASDDLDTVMSDPGAYNFDDLDPPAPRAPTPVPAAPQPARRPTPVPAPLVVRPTPVGTQPPLTASPRGTPSVAVAAAAPRMSQRQLAVDADGEPVPRRSKSKTLLPDDIVPQFRSELTLNRTLAGGYEVTNPDSGQRYALNEFEVSLARMLNGQRQVAEILEAGDRLEIPITLESLQKFIHQLEECGFLGGTSAPQAQPTTWPARGQWDSGVRSFFQSGVRLLRMGKHAEAATCFEALLAEDPENLEARELLAVARQHASVGLGHAPAMVALPMAGPVGAPQPSDPRRYLIPILIAAVALLCVALVYLFTRGPAEPKQTEPVAVKLEPDAAKPEPVKPDRVKPEPAKPAKPDPIKATATKPDPVKPEPVKPEPVKPDPAALPAIQVEAPAGGEVTAYLRGPRTVQKGERLFEISRVVGDPVKIKQAAAKLADLEKLAKQDHATYDAFVADARKNLASVRRVASTVVTAPRAGKAEPKVKPNSSVRAGQVMAVIQ